MNFTFKADLDMIVDSIIVQDDIFYIIKHKLNKTLAK